LPTKEQAIKAVILCQLVSKGDRPIELFRYNPAIIKEHKEKKSDKA
jgi:hypothetical protein